MKKLLSLVFLFVIVFSCKKEQVKHDNISFQKPDYIINNDYNLKRSKKPKPPVPTTPPSVIYLDFDGQYVDGTSWNYNGPIDAQPSGLDSISRAQVLQAVKTYYSGFPVVVTDNESVYFSANPYKRTRVIETTTWEWYGSAGGVSYINSFTWGDSTPCFVFTSLLNYSVKKIGDASAHEAGHTLGLYHQSYYDSTCTKINEYNPYPLNNGLYYIMGNSYSGAAGWGIGPNPYGCNNIQNDTLIIGNTLRK